MRLTVLGACGARPAAGQACGGYLVEHKGFRLVVDLGYATVPRLLERVAADQVDAVVVSHGHPDHCADLNPLLRARALRDDPAGPSPVYAPPGAVDAVLALDRPGMLTGAGAGVHRRHRPEPRCGGPGPRADLFLAEATYVDQVPRDLRRDLTSARQAGRQTGDADAGTWC